MEGKIWAVPDIHGRFDLLQILLGKLFLDEGFHHGGPDKIIFLGDYVDRGPESMEVIDGLMRMQQGDPEHVICLRGNHEKLFTDAVLMKVGIYAFNHWREWNGGQATIDSFAGLYSPRYINWILSRPTVHKEHGFVFTHAPLPNDNRRKLYGKLEGDPFDEDECIWSSHADEIGFASHLGVESDGTQIVGVCGHKHNLRHQLQRGQPLAPRLYDHYLYLDAGCGCYEKAPLIACEVKSRRIIYAHPPEKDENGT